ncbi:MAG: glycosyltransferase [Flavobacteriaceae bacterium]|nr:glycosyltransferase [Flavobacteriaceae bacterium]
MMIIGLIIGVLYLLVLAYLFLGNLKIKEFFSKEDVLEKNKFSIIIPFRNEAKNLSELMNSLQKINYPKDSFEIIFVDDESDDNSVKIIETELKNFDKSFPFKILKNKRKSNSPKKDAITLAVSKARYDWIITTDADCELPINWLQVFHSFIIKKQPLLIAAPVGLSNQESFIGKYQIFDLLSLQTVTMGSFGMNNSLLCNGANLCYKKEVFNSVNGYEGNNHIASGDDIFLLEKVKSKYPNKVQFLKSKEVIVITKTEDSWKKILYQRIRWASKTSKQHNWVSKLVGLVVFLCNLLVIIGAFLSFFSNYHLQYFLVFWMLKLVLDFLFIISTASFFRNKISFFKFIISSILHPFITTFVVVGSIIGTYSWKDRQFKK